ncbi:MAG: Fibronectin type III domain protein [Candidatus Magasanikbacteria bacterium GW2011_GWC2_42_27]|nr:MAG: Fibronectin type III domain protein [Candidatus Magasanikbacteria bacterium GW2011_GWC2_42_27]
MTKLLAKAGLNKQETIDFLEFWLPKMQEKPYVFVTFANQHAFESAAPLNITPAPDSVLRVFMNFKSLDTYTKVEPLLLRGFERKGFTVVEWGGILEKK